MFLGTQMYIITFVFACVELVLLFYLIIYKIAGPADKSALLNIWLVVLLLIYNITGGLYPDPKLPGSLFLQEIIAYATGFITPSYFPYYVYHAFELKKMRFHVIRGVSLFLLIPYFAFVIVYRKTSDLDKANLVLIIPVLYAVWVILSLIKALKFKYGANFKTYKAREEAVGLLLSVAPWIALPIIIFFNLGQAVEVSVTNTGFLLLLALQMKNHISQSKEEHNRLIVSEQQLVNWNTKLQEEVEKRTRELTIITEQKSNTLINLAHETKTPLTLIKNYIDEFSARKKTSHELSIVKNSIDKLTTDISSLLDMEKFERGLHVYDHNQITFFSELLSENLTLFSIYAAKKNQIIKKDIQKNIYVKADPIAISRITNNLVENSIKYSANGKTIFVKLAIENDHIFFSVEDEGIGIPPYLHSKVLEPYFQINHVKKSSQGLGLGLSIVKKAVDSLTGEMAIDSDSTLFIGTCVRIKLPLHQLQTGETASTVVSTIRNVYDQYKTLPTESDFDNTKPTVLIVEDNFEMVNYLKLKLEPVYNLLIAFNGVEALEKLYQKGPIPDLIVSDIMMDNMDGFSFAERIATDQNLNNIPFLFLSARSSGDDRVLGLKLGAMDFISKPFAINELQNKIASILKNAQNQKQSFIKSAIHILSKMKEEAIGDTVATEEKFRRNCLLFSLTAREQLVAKSILDGAPYKQIASSLGISEGTIRTHVQNIFEKVQVSSKIELFNKLSA